MPRMMYRLGRSGAVIRRFAASLKAAVSCTNRGRGFRHGGARQRCQIDRSLNESVLLVSRL